MKSLGTLLLRESGRDK